MTTKTGPKNCTYLIDGRVPDRRQGHEGHLRDEYEDATTGSK